MSAAIMIFDTLQYVKKLTAVGVSNQQAEIQAEALKEIIEDKLATKNDLKNLATKDDLRELELATKNDFKKLELATKNDLKELELATKNDLRNLEQELREFKIETRREFKDFKTETKRDFKELELRMVIKLGGIVIAGMAGSMTLVRLLHF